MKKKFESEIRILIGNIDEFRKKLKKFNATITDYYKFNDHLYYPKNSSSSWNLNFKTMRIREYIEPDQYARILFTENKIISGKTFQFKQSIFPQGKVELFKGDFSVAQQLLQSWDFQFYFKIEKTDGRLYEILSPQKFIIAVEEIKGLGFTAEIEMWGNELDIIENSFSEILSLLEIPLEKVKSHTLPYIIAEHLNLLKVK